jgi:hypothetical protein
MDFDVQRCTRHCAATGREFTPGEEFYSVLIPQGSEVVRQDYSPAAWQGPPDEAIGWWKSHMPTPQSNRAQWAPNDVMLHLFDELAADAQKQDMRYVLALLLVRRRVFRLEESEPGESASAEMVLYCPRRDATYHIAEMPPSDERAAEIQAELGGLLFTRAG